MSMEYSIYMIDQPEMLENCPVFHVDQFNWGGEYRPRTFGQMAYVNKKGFFLKMTCMEKDPICHYEKDNDPVYLDSTMEAFLALCPPSEHYINFEFNSKAALLAKYGSGRHGRTFFTQEQLSQIKRTVSILDDRWEITMLFPLTVLNEYFPQFHPTSGTKIRLNFFKLAEGDEMTHFASYAPIQSQKPDFHLPQFFADGILIPYPASAEDQAK